MESDKKLLFKRVIEYFAFAAIAVQAVFAAFWLFKNMGVLQYDFVAHTYILAAESMKVDDSMGILYALVVRLFGHGALLQIVQILLVSAAVFFFSLSIFERKAGAVIALLVVTNPLILQAETAVSPNALMLGCMLFAIACAVRFLQSRNWIWGMFGASLAAGFLNPDYAYVFFLAEAVFLLVTAIVRKKFNALFAAACIVAFLAPVIVNGAIRDDYAYGRVHRNVSFLCMQRVTWPRLFQFGEYYQDSDKVPENLAIKFAYELEHDYNIEYARLVYGIFAKDTIKKGFGFWGRDLIRDEVLNLFSPLSPAVVYLKHKTDTSVSMALHYLFDKAPKASRVYFLFSSAVSFLFTLMCVVKGIGERFLGKKEKGLALGFALLGIVLLVSLYATFICVREFDYRNVLFMVIGWPAAALALTERRKTEV